MKNIVIAPKPPRDLKALDLKIPFGKGLGGYDFFGAIFAGAGALALIGVFFPPFEAGLIIFKIFGGIGFGLIGILTISRTRRKIRTRVQAFVNGELCSGRVESLGKKFVPWKSARDFTAKVRIETGGGEKIIVLQSSAASLHDELPVGAEVFALVEKNTGSVFVPAEIGIGISPAP